MTLLKFLIFALFFVGCAGSITKYDVYPLKPKKPKNEVLKNFSKYMRFNYSESLESGYLSQSDKYTEVDTIKPLSRGILHRVHDLTIREVGITYVDIKSDSLYLKTLLPKQYPLLDFIMSNEGYYLRDNWNGFLAKAISQEALGISNPSPLKKKSQLVALSAYALSPSIGKAYEFHGNPFVTRSKSLQQLILPTLIDAGSLFLIMKGKRKTGVNLLAINRIFFWLRNQVYLYNRFASTPYNFSNDSN